jgi:hypothetical protein
MPFKMAGADHRQHASGAAVGNVEQVRGHVLIALVYQRLVDLVGAVGELREGAFQQVAFLERFDFLLGDLVVDDDAGEQPREQVHALVPRDVAIDTAQRGADIAIDEMQLEAAPARAVDGGAHFGAGLDAELFGDALLKGGHRQHGGDHRHLAAADHLEQIHALERVGVDHAAMAVGAQLDGDFIVVTAVDFARDGLGAGARHVRGAEQAHGASADLDIHMRLDRIL